MALPLIQEPPLTLSQALEREDDIVQALSFPEKRLDFASDGLYAHAEQIKGIVAHHLGVPKSACHMPAVKEWIHGSFNMCLPVVVNEKGMRERKVMIRFPLPYKVGETTFPGNIEEKLRCEVATYAWIQDHCPQVPIPRLFGFGFPNGSQSFTALDHAPLLSRLNWHLRRSISWLLGRPTPSRYVPHLHHQTFESGYLLVEYVSHGTMLSKVWDPSDSTRRATLFEDLARIILSLAQFPFARIGSLTINDDGTLDLRNRPLTVNLLQLENEGIDTGIPRDRTYETANSYALDLLGCHDNRIREQPNAIHTEGDGKAQLAKLTAMRALVPHFLSSPQHYSGPYSLQLTDLHASNIFVDEEWHITGLIDLEWACVRPLDMLLPPKFLGGGVDQSPDEEHMKPYREMHADFVSTMEKVEAGETVPRKPETTIICSTPMRLGLHVGSLWYFLGLESYSGMNNLFLRHISKVYGSDSLRNPKEFNSAISPFWQVGGVRHFLSAKLHQREGYKADIRRIFAEAEMSGPDKA